MDSLFFFFGVLVFWSWYGFRLYCFWVAFCLSEVFWMVEPEPFECLLGSFWFLLLFLVLLLVLIGSLRVSGSFWFLLLGFLGSFEPLSVTPG